MPDIAGGLVSGGFDLAGALLNYTAAKEANDNNMMMNTGLWKGQQIQNEAGLLGVSPLALLGGGGGGSSIPFQNVMSGAAPMLANAGQNFGRAISAADPNADRLAKLQVQHQELVNAGLQEDLVARATKNSLNAVNGTAQPPPIPAFARFVDPRTGEIFWSRTKDYAESSFAGDPVQMARGVGSSVQDVWNSYQGYFQHAPTFEFRPDLLRQTINSIVNTQGNTN